MGRDRKLPQLGEISPLEFPLERDPILPGALEREAEHLIELVGVIAFAPFAALDPLERLLG